jgi:hypothetical protein
MAKGFFSIKDLTLGLFFCFLMSYLSNTGKNQYCSFSTQS